MTTRRKHLDHWTEVKRVVMVDGLPHVKQTTCCCAAPGGTPKGCAIVQGNKTPCRCHCHRAKATDQEIKQAHKDRAKGFL